MLAPAMCQQSQRRIQPANEWQHDSIPLDDDSGKRGTSQLRSGDRGNCRERFVQQPTSSGMLRVEATRRASQHSFLVQRTKSPAKYRCHYYALQSLVIVSNRVTEALERRRWRHPNAATEE